MMMQYAAYVEVAGDRLLVLVREGASSRSLKLRKSGQAGVRLDDEEVHLQENPALMEALRAGNVVKL